ncbi:LCP family protein [Paenibacillus xerothermodurans]|uniref:LCP family protein n=1 Tax=Paenibacillus xerothermodurans TaxID=1977292 RepID=UPI0024372029|nr:LCP family protein [Paenibacillus xerothermodurans]
MRNMFLKILFSCVAVGAATTGVYAYSIYDKTTQAIQRVGTAQEVPEAESAKVKPLTLLLMGVDYRNETASLNTDVIMLATVNPENGSATLVSLPRDLQMAPKGLPSRKANYYYPYFSLQDKETAFANTKKVFSDHMGVPIDYMATVDFEGFRQVVDLMGGLTLNVDMDMRYVDRADGTDISLKKGVWKLNGKQTLDFVRYRKSNRGTEESSDSQRNARQQQVLNELMNSLKSTGGVAKLTDIIETVGNHIHTDIPSQQIKNLMVEYFDIRPDNIRYIHLDGAWESPYIVVKDEDMDQARMALKQQLGQEVMTVDAGAGAAKDDESGGSSTGLGKVGSGSAGISAGGSTKAGGTGTNAGGSQREAGEGTSSRSGRSEASADASGAGGRSEAGAGASGAGSRSEAGSGASGAGSRSEAGAGASGAGSRSEAGAGASGAGSWSEAGAAAGAGSRSEAGQSTKSGSGRTEAGQRTSSGGSRQGTDAGAGTTRSGDAGKSDTGGTGGTSGTSRGSGTGSSTSPSGGSENEADNVSETDSVSESVYERGGKRVPAR